MVFNNFANRCFIQSPIRLRARCSDCRPFTRIEGSPLNSSFISCLSHCATECIDFFHYVAFIAPHFPLHALPEDIERYRDRYLQGWDVLREERHERQQKLGINVAALSPLEEDVGPPYAFPDQIAMLGPGRQGGITSIR